MKGFGILPIPFLRARKPKITDPITEAERVEERLWLLALLLIFLLSVGLFLLSAAQDAEGQPTGLAAPLVAVLGNDVTTSLLLVMVLLISAYFRERLVARRLENRKLIANLCTANVALERRSQQLTKWEELSHALIANFDLPCLLDLIVATAIEVTQGEKASVMLLNDARTELHIAAARGLDDEVISNAKTPIGEGVAVRCARH